MMFVRQTIVEQCMLAAHEVTKDYRTVLLKKLKARIEGKCGRHGYVKPGSIDIVKVAPGVLRMISLNGDVIYTVQFKADICNPTIGSVIRCKVKNTNKFGVLAVSIGGSNTDAGGVVEIIVSKQGTFASDIDLNTLKIGDLVNVELLGKKFDIDDRKITGIGRVVTSDKSQDGGGGNGDIEEADPPGGSDEVEDDDGEPYEDENEEGEDTDDDDVGDEEADVDADGDVDGEVEEDVDVEDEDDALSIPESNPLDDDLDNVDDVPEDEASEYEI